MERSYKISSEYLAALVGKTGVGKTHIYNNLCNTSYDTSYSKDSLTLEIRRNKVCHGDGDFKLLDMPGNDSNLDVMHHALLIKEALTYEPLNTLFVLVPFDRRPGVRMIETYEETMSCLSSN